MLLYVVQQVHENVHNQSMYAIYHQYETKNNVLLKGTQKRPIAIIIDRTKILNDNNMISQNSDCLALLAFSQTILLKYIAENNKYKVSTKFNIISSEYTKRFDVPDYPNISR